MDSKQMVVTQIDAKLESLTTAGIAMRTGQLITEDEHLVSPDAEVDGETYTGHRYAASLRLEIAENDEGKQVMLTFGGPFIAAQHIADFDQWYLLGRASTYSRTKTLDETEHADAIAALNWIIAP